MTRKILPILALALACTTFPARGQGRTDYMNVESPQAHPLEIARVGGHDFLVACNTRNNTVEIFDTDESAVQRRVAVVRVGLEPVTVRFHPGLSRLYTANFLGDSISTIDLSAPAGPGTLSARLRQTVWVGDEPVDIAFYTRDVAGTPQETLFVTHMTLDGIDWRLASTLAPVDGVEMAPVLVQVGFDTSNPADGIDDETVGLAAKEPWSVAVHDGTLFVLALKGGSNSLQSVNFDLDYYCDDLSTPFAEPRHVGGLGTTGLSMGFDAAGDLYIVGAEALNAEFKDEQNVKNAATGFVRSMFWRIQAPCSDNPIVEARDVNLVLAGESRPLPLRRQPGPPVSAPIEMIEDVQRLTRPVEKLQALSMLTDLAIFERPGKPPKVFFTAFSNDRIGVIEPDPERPDPRSWFIRRIDIAPTNGNPLAGPNGLALKQVNPTMIDDPGARLYVLNHLDNSIATLDPLSETLVAGGSLTLSHDPRPAYLTQGQQFLYDAKLSGNGFTSCASCHVHGRTDRRVWDLGVPGGEEPAIPAILPDGMEASVFPADKGDMVTQSLQGLLNFEVAPQHQFWVTNAPYHWRGDRASFRDFNGAFVSLLGGQLLSDEAMQQFEAFVNSIHYPPNPKQPKDRVPSGSFGVGEDLATDGSSGAMRGQKIFHLSPVDGLGSCNSGCHAGPDGSNNRQTETGPIEVAALRGLFQREAKRDVDGTSDPKDSPYTGLEALTHTGFVPNNPAVLPGFDPLHEFNLVSSINAFNKLFFGVTLCGQVAGFCDDLQDLNRYTHEFDWGVGPLVGCPVTVKTDNVAEALPLQLPQGAGCAGACRDTAATLACMEQQADLANSGVSVQAHLGDADRGFWYDPISGKYREEPPTGPDLGRAELIGMIAGTADRLVFQAVPLGSERRVAAPDGQAVALTPGAPTNLRLLPMLPNTFNTRVPELTGTWNSLDNTAAESIFLHTVRLYQWGLILDAADENGFGLGTALRHDPPRRFQVSGENIAHGASLVLGWVNGPSPPDPELGLGQVPVSLIDLPIYATSTLDDAGRPIWQTAVEFEGMMYYAFMLGGPHAPGVATAFFDQKPFAFPMEPAAVQLDRPLVGQFAPKEWNWHYVFVLNPDGTFGNGGWQRLRIE